MRTKQGKNVSTLTKTQIEILNGLIERAIQEFEEMEGTYQRSHNELSGINFLVEAEKIKQYLNNL